MVGWRCVWFWSLSQNFTERGNPKHKFSNFLFQEDLYCKNSVQSCVSTFWCQENRKREHPKQIQFNLIFAIYMWLVNTFFEVPLIMFDKTYILINWENSRQKYFLNPKKLNNSGKHKIITKAIHQSCPCFQYLLLLINYNRDILF